MSEKILIEIKNLYFTWDIADVYQNLNLKIREGKITGIIGPSGIGKTTLLKLISGQIYPQAGEILFQQRNIHALHESKLYQLRKKIGVLFQSNALFTDLTVFENVAYPLREHRNLPEELITRIVLMKLETVGLRGAINLLPNELSGGMARRVALARATALDPEFIMYDEPFTGQDPINKELLVSLIKKLNSSLKLTSMLITHDLNALLSIADYIYILADKHVIAEGTTAEICSSLNPKVIQLLNGLANGPIKFNPTANNYIEDLFNDTHK